MPILAVAAGNSREVLVIGNFAKKSPTGEPRDVAFSLPFVSLRVTTECYNENAKYEEFEQIDTDEKRVHVAPSGRHKVYIYLQLQCTLHKANRLEAGAANLSVLGGSIR
jgi:hypothetical protein